VRDTAAKSVDCGGIGGEDDAVEERASDDRAARLPELRPNVVKSNSEDRSRAYRRGRIAVGREADSGERARRVGELQDPGRALRTCLDNTDREGNHDQSRCQRPDPPKGHALHLLEVERTSISHGPPVIEVAYRIAGRAPTPTAIYVLVLSGALLADLIHNFGHALTAIPIGLRSSSAARAESAGLESRWC
jgi:hypothetical protein